MLFKEYCILPYYQNCANQGIVINKKSSYCKDRANQGRLNQGLTVVTSAALCQHEKKILLRILEKVCKKSNNSLKVDSKHI